MSIYFHFIPFVGRPIHKFYFSFGFEFKFTKVRELFGFCGTFHCALGWICTTYSNVYANNMVRIYCRKICRIWAHDTATWFKVHLWDRLGGCNDAMSAAIHFLFGYTAYYIALCILLQMQLGTDYEMKIVQGNEFYANVRCVIWCVKYVLNLLFLIALNVNIFHHWTKCTELELEKERRRLAH